MKTTLVRKLATAVSSAAVAVGLLAPAAQAETGGLGQFLPFEFPPASVTTSALAGAVAVDPSDGNSIFVADVDMGEPFYAARIMKLSAGGATEAVATSFGVHMGEGSASGDLVDSLAVDPTLHRLYALVVAAGNPEAPAEKILVFSTQPDCSVSPCKLVPPSGPTAVSEGVADGVLVDFSEAGSAASGVDFASGIAVDPNGSVALLGVDDLALENPSKAVLQYFSPSGVAGTRLTGLGAGIDPDAPLTESSTTQFAGTSEPLGLAIGPAGSVFVLSGSSNERGGRDSRIYRLSRETDDPVLVATDPGQDEPRAHVGFNASFGLILGAGSPIALSSDGSTVYVVEGNFGFARVRGFNVATGLPTVFYGVGGSACTLPENIGSLGVAAGSGGFLATTTLAAFSAGTPTLYTFGENGTGCDRKVEPKFTIDGQSGATITLDKGAEVDLDASGSELKGLGAPVKQLDWDLDGSGAYATTDTDGDMKGTYRIVKAGTYQIGLEVESWAGIPPVTTPVFQTVKVVPPVPTASFTVSNKSPGSGEAVGFNASASVDPAGSPTAEPTHELATYKWDFGDGTTQSTSTATVSHAYTNTTAAPVARTVKLTVVSHDNVESAPVQQTVTVAAAPVDNPPSGGGDNPPSNGGSSPAPAPGVTPKPTPKPKAATCKKGQIKKKGKCVKKPTKHKPKKKHHK